MLFALLIRRERVVRRCRCWHKAAVAGSEACSQRDDRESDALKRSHGQYAGEYGSLNPVRGSGGLSNVPNAEVFLLSQQAS